MTGTTDDERGVLAGIDIGGSKIAALLVHTDGGIVARGVVPAPAREGGPAMADAAAGLVEGLLRRSGASLLAAGVGAAGVVDQVNGVIRAASDTFVGWAGFPLGPELERRLRVPVAVENDVNAFLIGEVAWGAAAETDDVLGVMLGTGVGGAVVLGGELRSGPTGAAGEIGHTPGYSDLPCTCGQVGHLETVASGRSIERRYQEAGAPTSPLPRSPTWPAQAIPSRSPSSTGRAAPWARLRDLGRHPRPDGRRGRRGRGQRLGPARTGRAFHPTHRPARLRVAADRRAGHPRGDAVALGAAASARHLLPTQPDQENHRTMESADQIWMGPLGPLDPQGLPAPASGSRAFRSNPAPSRPISQATRRSPSAPARPCWPTTRSWTTAATCAPPRPGCR
ncbi:ROK family protein [Tessaracoccus coleopterorum]|uniref:ROK family protein n=1 Tax=Tessaracoccus coleopterorum TaxID=2714950 RepID=UPI002F914851